MRSKQGQSDIAGFILGFTILVFLILFAFIISVTGALSPVFDYQVNGVTRFHACDTTLLSILQTDVPEQAYTFESAIVTSKPFTIEAKILLDQIYDPEVVQVELVAVDGCCLSSELCCSQFIPQLDGSSQEVCLVA